MLAARPATDSGGTGRPPLPPPLLLLNGLLLLLGLLLAHAC
jgi:hypothetical protein